MLTWIGVNYKEKCDFLLSNVSIHGRIAKILTLVYAMCLIYPCHYNFSHFESDVIGSFGNDNNTFVEYRVPSSSDSSPITGAPISYQDNTDASTNFLANNIDFGEFLDSAADIYPNKLKHAVCGKLTTKYINICVYVFVYTVPKHAIFYTLYI